MARAAFGETARSDWSIAGRYSPIMPTDIMKFLMPGFWTDRQLRQNYKQTRIDKQKPKAKRPSKPNGSEYFEKKGNHVKNGPGLTRSTFI